MTSEPQILAPGIRALDIPLVETQRDGLLGRFRSRLKEVPGILKPTRDQLVVLYGGNVGVVPLDWGQRPEPDTDEWREADRAALLRRDSREAYSLEAPSKSPDLAFDVVVEWTYTLTSAHTYMMELDGTSSTTYRDLVDRIVREKASVRDTRDPERLRIALDAKLAAEMNVRNDLVPGLETRFGRVEVRPPDPALKDREDERTIEWEEQRRAHVFTIGLQDQKRTEEQRQLDVARGRSVIRDDEETELLRGELRHTRQTTEVEQRAERERGALQEDEETQVLRAELGHKRHKVETGLRSERDELEHRRLMIEAAQAAERKQLSYQLDQATAEIGEKLQRVEQELKHIRLTARIEQNVERQTLELEGEQKSAELQEGITDVRARADLDRLRRETDEMLARLKEPNGPVAIALAKGETTASDVWERASENLSKEFDRLYALIGHMFRSEVDDDYDIAELRQQVVTTEVGRVLKSVGGGDLTALSPKTTSSNSNSTSTSAGRARVSDLEIDRPPEPAADDEPDDPDEHVIEAETVDEDEPEDVIEAETVDDA